MNVTVLGAGAWGTALAVHAAAAHATRLWARDAGAGGADALGCARNARYLPEIALPPALQVGADLAAALRHARGGLVVVATPMAGLEPAAAPPRPTSTTRPCSGCARASRKAPAGSATRSRSAVRAERRASACCPGRASRSRWRAASRRRWSRRAATPAVREAAVEAFHAGGAAHLHLGRSDRRRGRRRGQERARDRHRHRRRHAASA